MQRQGTIQFKKARSATTPSSTGRDSSGLVETASGTLHYVSKSVNFGVQPSVHHHDQQVAANGGVISDRSLSEGSWDDARKKAGSGEGSLASQIPPRGETRHVYLDMQWTKFGFRLQVSFNGRDDHLSHAYLVLFPVKSRYV